MEYQKQMQAVQEHLRSQIIETACRLYLAEGIEPVKMTRVAEAAQVGVASLYRYFGTKKELVILCGIRLWQRAGEMMEGIFTSPYYLDKTGLEQSRDLLRLFSVLYTGHADFLQFLRNFDLFMEKEGASCAELAAYEKSILDLQSLARSAFDKGLLDGTLRTGLDFDTYYFTAAHALMSLAQKLVCAGSIVESDARVSGEAQLDTLADMIICSIRADGQLSQQGI